MSDVNFTIRTLLKSIEYYSVEPINVLVQENYKVEGSHKMLQGMHMNY